MGRTYKPTAVDSARKMKRRFVLCYRTGSLTRAFSGARRWGSAACQGKFGGRFGQRALDLICPSGREAADRPRDRQRPDKGIADSEYRHSKGGCMRIGDAGGEQRQFVVRPGESRLVPTKRLRDSRFVHRPSVARLHGHAYAIGALHPEKTQPLFAVHQRWFGPCGNAIGARIPRALLRPPRRRTCSRSSAYSRLSFLWLISTPSLRIMRSRRR